MAIIGLAMFLLAMATSVFVFLASIGTLITGFVIYTFNDYRENKKHQDLDDK